ncbi:Ig-like domain-containing protein [Spirosoma endbachense]|uniref:Ig-like domain-containing protein n=1 Tax=Spirosoma endbachense TaxID=2666025 RepID=UPI001E3E95C7|nr:gliding motility-associated C-terminal domain-containing protein [Spirosoma endbachense]
MTTIANGQVVKHSYRFYNNLSVAAPECGPDITPAQAITGGACTPASTSGNFITDKLPICGVDRIVYHNNMHWGLKYANTTNSITTTYTIQMYVKVTKWGPAGWVRIIDFLDDSNSSDGGIYFIRSGDNHHFCLDFWPNGIVGACPFFTDTDYYLLTFTRNGTTGIIDVYVNNTLFKSYNDIAGRYASQTGRPIYIFRDKGFAYCESGEANFAYLSFSNQYASQADVDNVYKSICSVANTLPIADFSITPNPVCSSSQNLTITYSGDKLIPEPDYIFDWDWDGGRVVSGNGIGPYVVSWPTNGTKNISLSVKNTACGKPLLKTKQISIGNLDLTTSTKENCSGNSNEVISVSATNGLPPYQYSIDSINYQPANTFTVVPRAYTVYVKDANNCIVSKPVRVESGSEIAIRTIKDTAICQGQSIKLMTTSSATSFSWIPSIGLDNSTSKDPLATPTSNTLYIVTATNGACSKKDSVRITVTPPATLMPSSVPKVCGTFSLSANSTGFVEWSGPGITKAQSKQDTITVKVNGPATYKVRASVLVNGGCFIEKELSLNFTPPVDYRLSEKTRSGCDTKLTLQASTEGVWDKFRWQLPNETIVNTPSITAQTSGKYVVLASSSSTGCESRDTVSVNLGVSPSAPTIQNKSICVGEPVASLNATGTMIEWFSDSTLGARIGTGPSFKPPISSSLDGLYFYYLTQTVSGSCVSPAAKVQYEVKKLPGIKLMANQYTGCFSDFPIDTITLDAGENTDATYRWLTRDGLLLSSTQTISVKKEGLYIISVTDSQRCTNTDTVLVEEFCQPTLFAPDAFSPNGDNQNDNFELKGRLINGSILSIYNRWGELLLKTDKLVWDGNYQGEPCEEGLYTWTVDLLMHKTPLVKEAFKKAGQVLLIR